MLATVVARNRGVMIVNLEIAEIYEGAFIPAPYPVMLSREIVAVLFGGSMPCMELVLRDEHGRHLYTEFLCLQ